MKRTIFQLVAAVGFLLLAMGCCQLSPEPASTPVRLDAFPKHADFIEESVIIYWNEYQVPFIEAKTDRDLAYTLGLVHAHLRLGQIALLKRIAQGRLSEIAGPVATDIDRAIRILDFAGAAAEVEANWPPETREWVEAFVAGLNEYQNAMASNPPEFGIAGLEREPFTVRDILSIGRLAGVDVNWFMFFRLLRAKTDSERAELLQKSLSPGKAASLKMNVPGGNREAAFLELLLTNTGKTGSNSLVVHPSRSADGSAWIASDPHLGFLLPNLWLLVGCRSPSYHVVGMMIPGIPVFTLGRTPRLAWGGTNMRAASSDIYRIPETMESEITESEEPLRTRFWFDRTARIRKTPFGPLISDAKIVYDGDERLALRWTGHDPTDEITAFLRVAKARNTEEFRAAFEGYGVSGQNMLFATTDGDIGLVPAVRIPNRGYRVPPTFPLNPSDTSHVWQGCLRATELPWVLNPPSGTVASANNPPVTADVPLGFFYGSGERLERMEAMLDAREKLDFDALKSIQLDVYSAASHETARLLCEAVANVPFTSEKRKFLDCLIGWDGRYETDSKGAAAYEMLLYRLSTIIAKAESAEPMPARELVLHINDTWRNFPDETRRRQVTEAMDAATAGGWKEYLVWGDLHRLHVAHLLGRMPVLGRWYRYGDIPCPGSRETLWKSEHELSDTQHEVRYGSQSRHISGLGDPDDNHFVLFGGQDGWLGSANFMDQIPLWQRGEYIRIPLRIESVRAAFPHRTQIESRSPPQQIDREP
jgi:penicillin amidase